MLRHTSGLPCGFFGNPLARTACDRAHLLDDLHNAGLP